MKLIVNCQAIFQKLNDDVRQIRHPFEDAYTQAYDFYELEDFYTEGCRVLKVDRATSDQMTNYYRAREQAAWQPKPMEYSVADKALRYLNSIKTKSANASKKVQFLVDPDKLEDKRLPEHRAPLKNRGTKRRSKKNTEKEDAAIAMHDNQLQDTVKISSKNSCLCHSIIYMLYRNLHTSNSAGGHSLC
jgi:hypothetical protein